MAKMGPRKAPKNTAGSKTKQLEGGIRTPSIYQRWLVLKYKCHVLYHTFSNLQSTDSCCVPAYNKVSANSISKVYGHWNYHRNDWYHYVG